MDGQAAAVVDGQVAAVVDGRVVDTAVDGSQLPRGNWAVEGGQVAVAVGGNPVAVGSPAAVDGQTAVVAVISLLFSLYNLIPFQFTMGTDENHFAHINANYSHVECVPSAPGNFNEY